MSALDLLPGAAHAATTIALGYPFDTVKTRLQTGVYGRSAASVAANVPNNQVPTGVAANVPNNVGIVKIPQPVFSPSSVSQCIRASLKEEGLFFLYRGCSVPFMSLMLKRPVEFAIYESLNKGGAMEKFDFGYFVNGALAATVGAAVGCPFNVVKVRIQNAVVKKTVLEAIKEVHNERGFFQGLGLQFSFSIPSAGIYLGLYGKFRDALSVQNDGFASKGSAGALAGLASSIIMWSILIPIDTLRTHVQSLPNKTNLGQFQMVKRSFIEIHGSRGLPGFWSGLTTMYGRAIIITAPCMWAYETTRELVKKL